MHTLCLIQYNLLKVQNWYYASELILFVLIGALAIIVLRSSYHVAGILLKIIAGFGFAGLFLILSIINATFFFFVIFKDNYPPTADYHVLNAAIKNTCFLDPLKNHCPTSKEELISIESDNFTKLTKNTHLVYKYYPRLNQYTLIIRNNDIAKNNNRVAIFDPRIKDLDIYGHGKGIDFIDAEVYKCGGKYRLVNPLPFPGPWDEIE